MYIWTPKFTLINIYHKPVFQSLFSKDVRILCWAFCVFKIYRFNEKVICNINAMSINLINYILRDKYKQIKIKCRCYISTIEQNVTSKKGMEKLKILF